jgi:hypothetical protein
MKRIILSGVLAVTLCVTALSLVVPGCSKQKTEKVTCFAPVMEVPFDESMGKSETEFKFIAANSDDVARYNKAKAIYEKNIPSKVSVGQNPKIPKIIHQIWLGPNLPPANFAGFQEKIRALHPDWEYHLWSEAELEELKLDSWDIVEKSQNWAEKSDIIRSDLLDRFGGVYMDVDFDMHKSLNELHEKYDFYAGMEYPHKIATTNNRVWVGISIMASRPGHPIIQNWKRRIRSCWDDVDLRYSSQVERVINHTFFNFTHAVMQEVDQPGNTDMLFPATYFYPIGSHFAAKRRSTFRAWREKLYDILEECHLKGPRAFSRPYPETIAVHYWQNSWIPTTDMQMKEFQRLLDGARKDLYKMQQKVRVMERRLTSSEKQLVEAVSSKTKKADEAVASEKAAA